MKIERANKYDAESLTKLTIQSKSYWDYSKAQIELWKDDLTLTEQYFVTHDVYTLMIEDKLIGYYSYCRPIKNVVKLDNMFISPDFIGKGFGKVLMNNLIARSKSSNTKKIILDADSNAEAFYKGMGFNVIGQIETAIKNRHLPIMEMHL